MADDIPATRFACFVGDFPTESIAATLQEEAAAVVLRNDPARPVQGIDEWLTLIAAGQAIGLTSEATAVQYPRLGVTYRPVADAPPLSVWLSWWRDDPPPALDDLKRLIGAAYEGRT